MVRPTGVAVDPKIVAQVDAKIGRGSRSAWIRGAMRLRLAVEDHIAKGGGVTGWMKTALAAIETEGNKEVQP